MSENSIVSLSSIEYIKFGFNGDAENNINGVEINNYELFQHDGMPIPNGVYDLKMGTIDHNYLCSTCLNGKKLCPGHRGKYVLKTPVLQPLGISLIRKLLKIICFHCGSIVVESEKFENIPIHKRFNEILALAKEKKACPTCKTIHPKIVKTKDDYFTIYAEYQQEDKRKNTSIVGDKLYPGAIREIFNKISFATLEALNLIDGRNPLKLIISTIEIPPNCIRPSIKSFTGGSNYHDSTTILQNLIKRNNEQIPDQLPEYLFKYVKNANIDQELDKKLQNLQQFYYDLIMGSSAANQSNNSGKRVLMVGSRPVHNFMRNLTGKEGRLRGNLLGKRVLFMSRSTISGNMNYKIHEVGIPLEFAKIQQVRETVQEFNREFLMSIFLNGKKQYPGCTHIIKRSTGEMHDVSGLKGNYYIEYGDIICRNIIDGDFAFFNRQPTLERSSIGGHIIRVIKDESIHTFQMNVIACDYYNADFDGDQMNLWVSRDPAARAEAKLMSSVSNLFISTKSGNPVNGQVQDSKIGCYELTRHFIKMNKFHAMGLFTKTGLNSPQFHKYSNDHIFTGSDIITLLLEANNIIVNYSGTPKTYNELFIPYIPYNDNEKYTVIKDGKMLQGVLDSESIGNKSSGGLYHIISREYGADKTLDIIYYFQQIALTFLLNSGITVSTSDLCISKEANEEIHHLCDIVNTESNLISQKLINKNIIPPIDSTVHEFYELMQLNALKLNDSSVLKILLTNIDPDTNGFFKMISVGSKGNMNNMIHVSAAVGQITINGERIKEIFSHGRTLPYFPRFSFDSRSSGFINNNYVSGLTVSEFTIGAMNGRFDIINKALSTASTGYMTRKGVLSNQSSIINNHRHVVKDNKIVQFIYGEDGIDSRELEKVNFNIIHMNNDQLRSYAIPEEFINNYNSNYDPNSDEGYVYYTFNKIKEDRDKLRNKLIDIEYSVFGQFFKTSFLLPVNINRLIKNMPKEPTLVGLKDKIIRIEKFYNNMAYIFMNEIQEVNQSYVPRHKKFAAELVCISIRSELHPKMLTTLTDEQISYIISSVKHRYSISLIDYGSAVGILAAQAISEPLTQYMLDSHHRSVSGGTNKSGLVRVMEIYGAKCVSKEQSPSMQLFIKNGYATDLISTQSIANLIEYVCLKNLIKQYDILLESSNEFIYPPYKSDIEWVQEYMDSHPLIQKSQDLTNWCYRLIIDKTSLILKSIPLELIIMQIKIKFQGIHIVHTSESVGEIIIRIWPRLTQLGKTGTYEFKAIHFLENNLLECSIRGIKGILRATSKKINRKSIDAGGNLITEERLAIETIGTNLNNIFLYTAIDSSLAISNSIGDTNEMFGIEAARMKIINETLSFMQKDAPNLRHLYIYADEMTRTGKYTNLEKSGINAREHNNVLLRAAMSSPIQVFQEAAVNGITSKVSGISAPMLLGEIPKIGTIYNSFVVNENFIKNNTKSLDSVLDNL